MLSKNELINHWNNVYIKTGKINPTIYELYKTMRQYEKKEFMDTISLLVHSSKIFFKEPYNGEPLLKLLQKVVNYLNLPLKLREMKLVKEYDIPENLYDNLNDLRVKIVGKKIQLIYEELRVSTKIS